MAELEQPDSGDVVAVDGRFLVGRRSTCNLTLAEAVVSSEHAVIFWTGAVWQVRDLASRNGTFVDGERIESGGERALRLGTRLSFGARAPVWRLVDDAPPSATRATAGSVTIASDESHDLARLGLRFLVSADEEHVQMVLLDGAHEAPLPARAFHYLLLTLARARIEDRGTGPDGAEHGWRYADELAGKLGMDVERMNVDVFRARKQLAEAGVKNAASIVERRPTTHQLRIGVAQLEVAVQAAAPGKR